MLCVCVCECVLRVAGKTHSCVVIESKPKRSDCPKTTKMTETDRYTDKCIGVGRCYSKSTGIIPVYLILKNLHYHYPNAFESQVSCEITIIFASIHTAKCQLQVAIEFLFSTFQKKW